MLGWGEVWCGEVRGVGMRCGVVCGSVAVTCGHSPLVCIPTYLPSNVLKVIRCRSLQLDNTISCTSFEDKGEMVFLPPLWWTVSGSVRGVSVLCTDQ